MLSVVQTLSVIFPPLFQAQRPGLSSLFMSLQCSPGLGLKTRACISCSVFVCLYLKYRVFLIIAGRLGGQTGMVTERPCAPPDF